MRLCPFALTLCLALPFALPAAAQRIDDPANLMGERVSAPALADTLPIDHGAPALEQLLRKLRTRASMMLIVAHPDDEDSGLLTLESRGMGARVAMLTLTRGEGGQNLMSADFNDALGLIRTQELLGEDRYTGTDQFFGTEVDFGFSKTKEEAFRKWGHERVLYDAVRCVRLYRPLVLASVFLGEPTDGHGHHQVSGEISQEVFNAAADPKVFPEMGLPPWAPLRVYGRVPFARISDKGMFDYATGRYLAPRFTNYVTGVTTSAPPVATVTIHEGEKPPIAAFKGLSYVQWAGQGLALQKSQIGVGVGIPPAGIYDVGYTLMGSRVVCTSKDQGGGCRDFETPAWLVRAAAATHREEDLFTGIDTSLASIAELAPAAAKGLRAALLAIDARLAEAQRLYDPNNMGAVAGPLRQAMILLDGQIKSAEGSQLPVEQAFNLLHELRIKRVQLNDALVLALGVEMDASAEARPNTINVASEPSTLVGPLGFSPGGLARVHSVVSKPLDGVRMRVDTAYGVVTVTKPSKELTYDATFVISPKTEPTRPYFSRPNVEQSFYDLSDARLRNAAESPAPFTSVLTFESEGVALEVRRTPTAGFAGVEPYRVRLAAAIVPALNVGINPLKIVSVHAGDAAEMVRVDASLSAEVGAVTGTLVGRLPDGWAASSVKRLEGQMGGLPAGQVGGSSVEAPPAPAVAAVLRVAAKAPFALERAGLTYLYQFEIEPKELVANAAYTISASAETASHVYGGRYVRAGYAGLALTPFYIPATQKVVAVDVVTAPGLKIAYLPGTGDDVPRFIPSLGVSPVVLSAKDLTLAKLMPYDAILLGLRAYSAHPELAGAGSQPLIDYARQGGVVIVQYSSGGFDPASAPYAYTVPGDSAHNVVDESVPVTILAAGDALLNWPNRIVPADFDHWIEERGHGFASDWAPQYTPLLEMHDPEQDPQKGGLLVARVGKGAYVYCALALYRQLPEGVPGSYRLLANLLSYAKNPSR